MILPARVVCSNEGTCCDDWDKLPPPFWPELTAAQAEVLRHFNSVQKNLPDKNYYSYSVVAFFFLL
jgi:hypothetical protein